MPATDLNTLVQPVSVTSAFNTELSIATSLGLPVTAWQPLGIGRQILYVNANVISLYSSTVNLLAQGGYASYAALMVDASGAPITTWMDLIGTNNYNVTRIQATYATTDSTGFSVTNSSANPLGPYSAGQLHFANAATGKTYTNTGTVTIAGNASTGIAITSDATGSAYSSGVGTITQIVSPTLANCTCTNSKALVGSDAETNAAYLVRCQAKLGSLSPNGPAQAYYFVATSITDSTQRFYNAGMTATVTRCTVVTNPGEVDVYIATASGGVTGCTQNPVTAATNANPIAITTTNAHGMSSGDSAIISGVLGNTAANGQFVITSTGANTFTIPVTGNGAYTSGGIVEGGNLGLVDSAIQKWATPDGVTAVVQSATPISINVVATIYIPSTTGYSAAQVQQNASTAIATYLNSLKIGGATDQTAGVVPWSALLKAIFDANTGTTSVTLATPAADVALTSNQVAVQGTAAIGVVFT